MVKHMLEFLTNEEQYNLLAVRDNLQCSAVHYAAYSGYAKTLKCMADFISPDQLIILLQARDWMRHTPLEKAQYRSHQKAAAILEVCMNDALKSLKGLPALESCQKTLNTQLIEKSDEIEKLKESQRDQNRVIRELRQVTGGRQTRLDEQKYQIDKLKEHTNDFETRSIACCAELEEIKAKILQKSTDQLNVNSQHEGCCIKMANLRKTLEDLKSIPDALLKQWDSLTGCQENAECVCKERYKNCQENEKHCKQETDLLRRKHKSLQGQTNELKSCVATLEDEACSVNHKITGIEHRLDDVQSSVDKNMPYGRAERNQPSDSLIEAVQARDPG